MTSRVSGIGEDDNNDDDDTGAMSLSCFHCHQLSPPFPVSFLAQKDSVEKTVSMPDTAACRTLTPLTFVGSWFR